MTDRHLSEADAEYVERMGLLWESEGLPRIAGRILGYLIVAPEAGTSDDMALALGVSRASVNTDVRRLERLGYVERVSRPGDRRDFYTIAPDLVERMLDARLTRLRSLQSALDDARSLPKSTPAVQERVCAFHDLHLRVVNALEGVLRDFRSCSSPATKTTRQAKPVNHK